MIVSLTESLYYTLACLSSDGFQYMTLLKIDGSLRWVVITRDRPLTGKNCVMSEEQRKSLVPLFTEIRK